MRRLKNIGSNTSKKVSMLLEYGYVPTSSKLLLINTWKRKWRLTISSRLKTANSNREKMEQEADRLSAENLRIRLKREIGITRFPSPNLKWWSAEGLIFGSVSQRRWTSYIFFYLGIRLGERSWVLRGSWFFWQLGLLLNLWGIRWDDLLWYMS